MAYEPGNLAGVPTAVVNEFRRLAAVINGAVTSTTYATLYSEPSKLFDGLTVLADGTSWNPGSGQGVYTYYASAWHKLG